MSLTQTPNTDPTLLLRFRDRQYSAELLAAAILEFDLFGYLAGQTRTTFSQMCDHFGWQSRPADVLMTLCRASGLIAVCDDDCISMTEMAREHLDPASAFCLTPYYRPIADSPIASMS